MDRNTQKQTNRLLLNAWKTAARNRGHYTFRGDAGNARGKCDESGAEIFLANGCPAELNMTTDR